MNFYFQSIDIQCSDLKASEKFYDLLVKNINELSVLIDQNTLNLSKQDYGTTLVYWANCFDFGIRLSEIPETRYINRPEHRVGINRVHINFLSYEQLSALKLDNIKPYLSKELHKCENSENIYKIILLDPDGIELELMALK